MPDLGYEPGLLDYVYKVQVVDPKNASHRQKNANYRENKQDIKNFDS